MGCTRRLDSILKLMLLTAFAIILMVPLEAAAEEQLSLKAKPGFNGVYKTNSLIPVQVIIENKGEPLSANIVITQGDKEYQSSNYTYQQQVVLATGEVKKVNILLPAEMLLNGDGIALVAKNQLIAKAPLQGLSVRGDAALIIGISARGDIHRVIMDANQGQEGARVTTGKTITPEDLPEDYLALKSIDIIVLDGQEKELLTPKQLQSIQQW
ncbi:MAG: hypothetical protein SCK28_13090, partial [Bacillota bacterium]|nr:hypothetical protein [Bacillota bacterium]